MPLYPPASGSGAPTDATYITQTANGSLSAEQDMGSLATGIVKNTTTTGVQSIAAQGTDYYAPGGTDVAVADGGTGASTLTGIVQGNGTSAFTASAAPTISDFTNMAHDHGDADDGGALVWQALPTGAVVQVVETLSGAVATGSTTIPYDDTIPQNTEGDQYMTLAITPKATTHKLYIEACANVANTAASQRMIGAIFQDTTANALAVGTTVNITANTGVPVIVFHEMAAGTTSSTTFKLRVGANNAGTTTLNGDSGARKFGGITFSWMRITEVKA